MRCDALELLARLSRAVIVVDAVRDECLADAREPGARAIADAFSRGWLREQPEHPPYEPIAMPGLGSGEAAAIGLAEALRCRLLIDERLGRVVAQRRGIEVVSSLGILLRAKRAGLIEAVGPLIERLRAEGMRVSDAVVDDVLRRAGELLPDV